MSINIKYLSNDSDTARLYLIHNYAATPVERNIYHLINEIPKPIRHYAVGLTPHKVSIGGAAMCGKDVVNELYPDAENCKYYKGAFCILDSCVHYKDGCHYPWRIEE